MSTRFQNLEPNSPVRHDPWIERLTWLMDSSIGIGKWRIGIDPLLGLIPGLGDAAGGVVSLLIVALAIRAGVPRVAAARMIWNVIVDALAGAVPLGGDLFDFAFKANAKNLRIYNSAVAEGKRDAIRHWLFFACLGLAALAVLALPIAVFWVILGRTR